MVVVVVVVVAVVFVVVVVVVVVVVLFSLVNCKYSSSHVIIRHRWKILEHGLPINVVAVVVVVVVVVVVGVVLEQPRWWGVASAAFWVPSGTPLDS